MKKLVALCVGVAFAMTTAGLAVAQTTTAPAEKKTETTKKAPAKKAPMKSASGTVKSASADSVVVAGKTRGKATEWTFGVDPKTSIKKAGKSITAADLKEGDSVSVRYKEADGKAMAQSITVRAGKMAAKKPAAAPAEKK